MKTLALAALMSAAIAAPAFAQTSTTVTTTSPGSSYYIVQDASTKKCTITHEKPTTSSMTIVGNGTVYKTETEAQNAIKTTKVCTQ